MRSEKEAAMQAAHPERTFVTRQEADVVAKQITAMPRKGVAHAQFYGYLNAWIVEIHPRGNRYGNPRVLREDGTAVGYIEWADSFRPIAVFA